jgi:hypothetical protein
MLASPTPTEHRGDELTRRPIRNRSGSMSV